MSSTRITWRDTLLTPEDGNRYEAIDGELCVTPAPSLRHQWVSARLFRMLDRLLAQPGHGYVFHAPTAVAFADTEEGVQPDLVFVSNERSGILAEEGLRGAPDLVVEITSPKTAERDRTLKRKLYERQGVAHYWVVDLETEVVEVWDFEHATELRRYTERVAVELAGRSLGAISVPAIFPPDR